jgi:hypothetical protein
VIHLENKGKVGGFLRTEKPMQGIVKETSLAFLVLGEAGSTYYQVAGVMM